ncbi:MAG: hypothetical protein ACI9TY_001296 [Alphaproteobacteria bacterium]|jgi:hypothetical protein
MKKYTLALAATSMLLNVNYAMANDNADIQNLQDELKNLRALYESRLTLLENNLSKLEATKKIETSSVPAMEKSARTVRDNSFNPSIGLILNGTMNTFSSNSSEMAGLAMGEEGERGKEGFSIGESELNISANIDDKFKASSTIAIVNEDGSDIIELEEAYIETLGGTLPYGLNVKAGRALWTLGYLNEHHAHSDDFADRPLPYRAFLNKAYNDDGIEASMILPTDLYTEIGGGVFRGDDFPHGGADSGVEAWSAFARVGGDIGDKQSWRLGASTLQGSSNGRASNEDVVNFTGDSDLYIADVRYTWTPTGNSAKEEVIFQGEYFYRDEDGRYEDTDAATGLVSVDGASSGWYAQGIYKWSPSWRAGIRYSQLNPMDTVAALAGSALDAKGYKPKSISTMLDWTNSEFSRLRFQYNHEELSRDVVDKQFVLQYTMSLGAHGAHKF